MSWKVEKSWDWDDQNGCISRWISRTTWRKGGVGVEGVCIREREREREEKRTGLILGVGEATWGEGNGTPLQCSCLENPRNGGAWWAAVYGVAQSRTRLKRLSGSSSSRGNMVYQDDPNFLPFLFPAWLIWACLNVILCSQVYWSTMALHKTPRAIWNIFLQCKQKSFNQSISGSFLREDNKGSPFCILCMLVLVNNEWTNIRH